MKTLKAGSSIYFVLKAIRSVSGSNGSDTDVREECNKYIKEFEEGVSMPENAIVVAGIPLSQFFVSSQNLANDADEVLLQSRELATDAGYRAKIFVLTLSLQTWLGTMGFEFQKQNKTANNASKAGVAKKDKATKAGATK